MDRYWITNSLPLNPNLSGYVAIVDENEGGIIAYVLRHRANEIMSKMPSGGTKAEG